MDAIWLMNEGADIVGVARVGIAHPDWPEPWDKITNHKDRHLV